MALTDGGYVVKNGAPAPKTLPQLTARVTLARHFLSEYGINFSIATNGEVVWPGYVTDDVFNNAWALADQLHNLADTQAREYCADDCNACGMATEAPAGPYAGILAYMDAKGLNGIRLGDGLRLSRAKPDSVNYGSIYVKYAGSYLGRIRPDGVFAWSANRNEYGAAMRELDALQADPEVTMIREGKASGWCAFCGRQLDDPESVQLGYGPVCARKYGLPHGNRNGY